MDIVSVLYLVGMELFNLLPLVAYFFIHKKFNTIWTRIAFYSLLFASILSLIKNYGMQGFTGKFDENGIVVGVQEASKIFYYTSYIQGLLTTISILSFVTFSILLHRKK